MKIGETQFKSKEDYNAGMRDYKRIQVLKLQENLNNPAVAARVYQTLKRQPYFFESELGRSFLRELGGSLSPKERGLGVGIKRTGYQETDVDMKREEVIRNREEVIRNRQAAPLRTSNTGHKNKPIEINSNRDIIRVNNSKATVIDRIDENNQKNVTKNNQKNENKNKQIKKMSIFTKLAGSAAAIILFYCIGNAVLYQYQSYLSEQKMSELQSCILQKIKTVSDESSVILDKIALASTGDEGYTVRTLSSGNTNELLEEETPAGTVNEQEILFEYSGLYERNSDLIGWIEVPGTVINYPVMQTKQEEEFYLKRDFDKESDINGLPFLDAESDITERTDNLLIYGHNMKNGSMFHALLQYKDEVFYLEHSRIIFNTIYEKAEYEIVAVFQSAVAYKDEDVFRYYNFIDAADEEEFSAYITNIKALAEYDTGVTAEYGDELITLSTCDRSIEDGRYVVVARKCSE